MAHLTPCRFYNQGRCIHGSDCRFLHEYTNPSTTSYKKPTSSVTSNQSKMKDAKDDVIRAITVYRKLLYPEEPVVPASDRFYKVLFDVAAFKKRGRFYDMEHKDYYDYEDEEMEEDEATQEEIDNEMDVADEDEDEEEEEDEDEDEDSDLSDFDFGRKQKRPVLPLRYMPPMFLPSQIASFHNDGQRYDYQTQTLSSDPVNWSRLDAPGIKKIYLGPRFSVRDEHFQEFMRHPVLCQQLEAFHAGDSDTGNGGDVRNEDLVIQFFGMCKNIKTIHLEAFTHLSDKTLVAICERCPKLRFIHLSGNDKVQGEIEGRALIDLADNLWKAPQLQELQLYDQPFGLAKKIKKLSKNRPTLWVKEGDTLGNGISANMVAAMDGGAQINTWVGGHIARVDVDEGIYKSGLVDMPMIANGGYAF